jgi:hypothetical protein
MLTRPSLKYRVLLIACLALQIPTQADAENAVSPGLTAAQLLKPDDLTPKELDFYKKQSDPEIMKNFIITRSYVRLCQQVIDKKMPAELLPDKPLGFSAHYLLSGEATMINHALSDSIVAMCKTNRKACLGN